MRNPISSVLLTQISYLSLFLLRQVKYTCELSSIFLSVYSQIHMDISENIKGLVHILDVRDWMLTLYEEKCVPLLNKLHSSIIPELCPHYGRFYKTMLDECEKKMYELRTAVVHVEVAGFNHCGKNTLCNRLIRRDILLPADKSRDKSTPARLCFQSGPVAQHNNAKLQFNNDATFLFQIKTAEENLPPWDEGTLTFWMKYKTKLQDIYDRRFEGVTYKAMNNEDIVLFSRQPSIVKSTLFSKITLITQIMGLSRYGITLGETIIESPASSSIEFEILFSKAQVLVLVLDEPKVQLTSKVINACMQQKLSGKDIIFVLHRKYDSDVHTSSQYNFMSTTMNKCNMFSNEKIHILDFNSPVPQQQDNDYDKNFSAFERHLATKMAEHFRSSLISCVEKFYQLVSCAEQLLTRFVSSYSLSNPERVDLLKNIAQARSFLCFTNPTQEEIFDEKLSHAEKTLNKEILKLKKSSRKFFKEFIKDMIPYMEIHAVTYKIPPGVSDVRREILMSLNNIFITSFEGLYLEWVHVKRSSFMQCLQDSVTPLLDYLQLEIGRNNPPPIPFLLQYAKGLVTSEEQQSEDFKIPVANNGVVMNDSLLQIQLENITLLETDESSARQSAYMEFLVHLMRIQSDNQISLALSTGAFGICTILKEYMIKNIRQGFAAMRSLARLLYPTQPQVEYSMLCNVLYLRDDIARHVTQFSSMLLSVAEFPTLARMRKLVATYTFSDPGMCAMCLQKYSRCSHLCASCSVDLKGHPCPFCNKWSHFSEEIHATVSNMGNFIANLSRTDQVARHNTYNWGSSTNRTQIYTAINKNGKVITEFQNWYTEILNRNDFTASKATEVFTCFVNAIIAKHTPPECRNLPDNYQKIMMKCVSELFSDNFFPAILEVFKKEYREQDATLRAKTELFKHCKASSFIKDYEEASTLDQLDLFKAVVEFNKISTLARPFDKCEKVLKAADIITNLFTQVHILMGADLFLPCIVFVLVQSNLEHPVAEFHFLCSFMETHCAHFEQYILQTFYSVIVSAPAVLDQMLLEGNVAINTNNATVQVEQLS